MEVIKLTYPFTESFNYARQTLAIGYFDGVHTGHQEVLNKAVSIARRDGIDAAVMTFDPHPREVLGHLTKPSYITPLNEKLNQFAALGMDRCYVVTFNMALSGLTPEQFLNNILLPLQVDTAVVGFNFTYGHLGRGNIESLRKDGGDRLKVHVIRPFLKEGTKVSSTLIREMIHQGSMERIRELLGRPYSITGTIVHGMGRGRTIGVPTANIDTVDNYVIPNNGVYVVRAQINNEFFGGVMNVGVKPTFESDPPERTLEAHLLDFNRMIYGQQIKLEFLSFIREEQKFASVDQLVAQIHADINKAKSFLELFNQDYQPN